jgi:hypothetical protein
LSAHGDHLHEMSGCEPLDEATFKALLEDVRSVVSHLPAPEPTPALAAILTMGVSTEKGELLARAGSKVTGPAPQASGLPKWRQDEMMGSTGFLSGLATKFAGIGVPAKVLMALGISMTGLTAGAGAGALPAPVQSTVAGVVNTVTPFQFPTGHGAADSNVNAALGAPGTGGAPATLGVGADAGAGNGTPSAGAGGGASASATAGGSSAQAGAESGAVGDLPLPDGLPVNPGDLLHNLPVHVPSCVSSIIDSATGHVISQPSALASQVLSCVTQLAPAGTIPSGVSSCISSLLNSASNAAGGGLPTLNVSGCVPVDVSQCVSSIMSKFGNPAAILGNLGSFGNLANLGNLTNITSLPGCVPFNLDQCVSSILGAAPGGLGTVDLSSCVPANMIGNLPLPFGH